MATIIATKFLKRNHLATKIYITCSRAAVLFAFYTQFTLAMPMQSYSHDSCGLMF